MVYPMMGGGIENKFEPSRHFMDGLGMDPELIDQTDLLHEQNPQRVKTDQGHPSPKQKSTGGVSRPGLSQGCRQIIMKGGMMHHMASPKIVYMMASPVKPIIGKIISQKQKQPKPPFAIVQRKNPESIKKTK